MASAKTILFPFLLESAYFDGYAWSVELAHRMNARLCPFTANNGDAGHLNGDYVYHSLLEAHGYYLRNYRHRVRKDVTTEPYLTSGEIEDELTSFLSRTPVEIVIIDSVFLSTHRQFLSTLVSRPGGTIVLSPLPMKGEAVGGDTGDRFYDHLTRAKLHNLPANFFPSLSKDHSAFNYLRHFFQKRK